MRKSRLRNRDTSDDYGFRPVRRADLAMLGAWLQLPQVSRWWGDPAEQLALLESDLDEPGMVMNLATFQGRAYAYIQDYPIHCWPQPHLPSCLRAAAALIVSSAARRCSATAPPSCTDALQLRAAGALTVAIDPDVRNLRARHACLSAGFRDRGEIDTPEGQACLLVFNDWTLDTQITFDRQISSVTV